LLEEQTHDRLRSLGFDHRIPMRALIAAAVERFLEAPAID